MSYNGWTNYETWNVRLWLENEEPSYRRWREATATVWEEAKEEEEARHVGEPIFTCSEIARRALADLLQQEITEGNPLADAANMYADLLGTALSEVNWDEIANACLEDGDLEDEDGDGYESLEIVHSDA